MSVKCKICGYEYVRKECDYCKRAKKWDDTVKDKMRNKLFPVRVAEDLKGLTITVKVVESLFIHGPVGSGKTLYAAQLLMELNRKSLIEHGFKTFCFIKVSKLLLHFKDAFNVPQGESALLDKYTAYDYLVLDDIASEKMTEWGAKMLFMLIDNRYEAMKPLIVTSNLPMDKLTKHLKDERLTSRLGVMCEVIQLTGADFRKTN